MDEVKEFDAIVIGAGVIGVCVNTSHPYASAQRAAEIPIHTTSAGGSRSRATTEARSSATTSCVCYERTAWVTFASTPIRLNRTGSWNG